ncbi:MAG: diguanylate cyclase, partial [Arcobacteraceae bacterium]
KTHYNILLETQKHISYAISQSVLRNTDLVELLENSYNQNENIQKINREKLMIQLTEQYKTAQKQGVLQLQFVFKDNVSFLRVHKPSKFGDNITDIRDDFKYTSITHKPIRGFTQGRTAHGFRNIFPIFNKDEKYIGAMEISFTSENLQWYLNNVSKIHSHFLVNKDIFIPNTWKRDDLVIKYEQSAESENYMLNINSMHTVQKCIVENKIRLSPIKEDIKEKISLCKSFATYVSYNGHIDVVTFIPVHNLSNKVVAWIVSYDENKIIENALFNRLMVRIISLLTSLLIIFLLAKQVLINHKINVQHNLLEDVLDNNDNIIIITDFKDVKYTNNKFNELLHIASSNQFNDNYNHHFIDIFIPMDGYLSKELLSENEDFISLINRTPEKDRVVAILNEKIQPKAYQINISKSKNHDDYIVSLSDITKLKEYQVKTEHKAYIDGLTQVYNRNKFDEIFTMEMKNTQRYKTPLSIAIIDIDKFKNFNDTYGHLIGDEVLIEMAQTVQNNIRETDTFARWGGEEFVILFKNTIVDDAKIVAEHIKGKIEQNSHKTAGKITASFGVTQFKENDTLETIFKRCDKALYKAKENGRNRVESL